MSSQRKIPYAADDVFELDPRIRLSFPGEWRNPKCFLLSSFVGVEMIWADGLMESFGAGSQKDLKRFKVRGKQL